MGAPSAKDLSAGFKKDFGDDEKKKQADDAATGGGVADTLEGMGKDAVTGAGLFAGDVWDTLTKKKSK